MAETFWTYIPQAFDLGEYSENLWSDLYRLTQTYQRQFYGKPYITPRRSCVFTNLEERTDGIYKMDNFNWEDSKVIYAIKLTLEDVFDFEFDYCLAHIYRDGKDYIPWHNDKEALQSDVVSVSFGEKRKFRLRRLERTSGYEHEFLLGNGDLFIMHMGCQEVYEHTVPKELKVVNPRINLTFRKYDR